MSSDSKADLEASITHVEQSQSPPPVKKRKDGDEALAVLGDGRVHHEITPEEDRRVLRKIDLWIMPLILIIYALQQLDKCVIFECLARTIIEPHTLPNADHQSLMRLSLASSKIQVHFHLSIRSPS